MSQAFKCDGCGDLKAEIPQARCTITTRLCGTRDESSYEYCATCAGKIGRVPEAARRVVTPPLEYMGSLLEDLANASEAVGYGRHAHPGNIVQVLRDKALGKAG